MDMLQDSFSMLDIPLSFVWASETLNSLEAVQIDIVTGLTELKQWTWMREIDEHTHKVIHFRKWQQFFSTDH